MNIKIIAPVHNIVIAPTVNKFTLDFLTVSNDQSIIDNVFDTDEIVCFFGALNIEMLSKGLTVSYFGPSTDIRFFKNISNENHLAKKINELIDYWFFYLWFIKDNSVCSPLCYLLDMDRAVGVLNHRDILISNASGEYTTTEFTEFDVQQALTIFFIANSLFSGTQKRQSTVPEFDPNNRTQASDINYINYDKSVNRVERAIRFLHQARITSFLPQKISFYVCLLECLFTTGNDEITHKVSERVAWYIGGTKLEKLETYKLVKSAYGIRSNYFHGSDLNKSADRTKLILISTKIDTLIRTLLVKVITEDSEIFLHADLDLWFTELIFKD